MNFDRIYSIEVSPNFLIEELRIKFQAKKTLTTNGNFCAIDIFNLSDLERNAISSEKYATLTLKVGYADDVGLLELGKGDITSVTHEATTTDIITTIHCKDGFKSLTDNYIQLSFAENTLTSKIITSIVEKIGLPLKFSNITPQPIKNGYSFVGTVSEALNDLAFQYGFTWSIQNKELQILKNDTSTKINVFLLSEQTGLIQNPSRIIENKSEKSRYFATCLLNPRLQAGDLISLKSTSLSGTFIIHEVTHVGDTEAIEWYTKIILGET